MHIQMQDMDTWDLKKNSTWSVSVHSISFQSNQMAISKISVLIKDIMEANKLKAHNSNK
jgi:hypothetical protein